MDRDIFIIDNAVSNQQEIHQGTDNHEFTVSNSGSNLPANENLVNVKTLKRRFIEKIGSETCNIFNTVEDRIQNTNLAPIAGTITPKIELAIRSKNASSGQDSPSVMPNSKREVDKKETARFKTSPKGITHYVCWKQMMGLKTKFRTK